MRKNLCLPFLLILGTLSLLSCADNKGTITRLYENSITIIGTPDGSNGMNYDEADENDVTIIGRPDNLVERTGKHYDVGGFLPAPNTNLPELIFKRKCYTVSYNKETKQPNWVAWHLRGECVIKREDDVWHEFLEDSCLAEGERATLEDYAASGYDRGHMCPVGDCNWNIDGRDETFLLSNICPQNSNLNRGDWKEIEHACRRWAKRFGDIYIVCGPVFLTSQQHERIGPNMIPVPEAFFKVVLCLNDSPKGIGFICRNTDGNRKKDFYVNSIRQVERITGYRFFPNLSDSIKDVVFDMSDISVWQE